ncbi:hypothetical protein LJR071_000148 [Pseudomonas sp. LjRoot71]|uniref:hypothetical protein n=1 Tax=Pseudomonas sp. LjRoot71 TaxID=3342336 RepID=UPI003ECF7015
MRLTALLFALTTLASTSILAQQPPKMPATAPATGAPGTATPQPYAPVPAQHLPNSSSQNPPLLNPLPKPEAREPRRDEDLRLLQEQRERNAQPVLKSAE